MLDSKNHLRLIDFGTAYFMKADFLNSELLNMINKIKQAEQTEEDTIEEYQSKHKATFVGTAE